MWLVALLVSGLSSSINSKLTLELTRQIEEAKQDQMVSCIVIMKEIYPYDEVEGLPIQARIAIFREIARTSQRAVIEWLGNLANDTKVHQQYWVLNGFHLEAKPKIIMELAKRDDVSWISHNGEVHIIAEPNFEPVVSSRATPWGIRKIKADSCWAAGFTGQGVILGETDTGVDYTHPALQGKWSGYWHVSAGLPPSSTPYDDHNHGTHCMGTIMGGDGSGPFGEDIGVAFNATFAAAKVLNSGGSGSYTQCAEGLQFMADLKDSVDIKAVSNSWAGPSGADTFFYPITRTYISIGILPVFANGNSGPNPSTVQVPGNYSNVVGVGATDSLDDIANFSSRGPAPNAVPYNDPSTWLRNDWNLIKPNISAPGVAVRSCLPGGSYASWNGTSMATPHVTGSVGIICQKNPNITPQLLYDILLDNADQPSQGGSYPNNNYGWGRLNVWRALNGTPTINQPWISLLNRTITDPPPGGNNNGILEPGETGKMVIEIKNVGGDTAKNTTGLLKSYDNYITVTTGIYSFGNLLPQQNGSNSGSPFSFNIHNLTPQGHKAKVGVILHADGDHDTLDYDDTLYYTIQIGTPPPPTVIYEDDFEYGSGIDSFLNYWDKTGRWKWSTRSSHSPTHSAYSDTLVDGTVTLTLKNAMNLTGFTSPELDLWHRYKFDNGFWTDAFIEISSNGGSSWSALWTLPTSPPDTIPWTEQTYSIASYATNNVKVRFRLVSNDFFQNFNDWWIDDFKIRTPTDNEPPYFTNTTVWRDTNFTGPFPVRSKVTDASGVDSVYLYYRVNAGPWQKIAMAPQGGDVYQASIPSQGIGNTINYYLWARDRWRTPNIGTDPVGAPGSGYYSFTIRPVGIKEEIPQAIRFTPLSPNPTKGIVEVGFGIPKDMKVSLVVYDVMGRKIQTIVDGKVKAGAYKFIWDRKDNHQREISSGIYFLKFSVMDYNKIEKLILIK